MTDIYVLAGTASGIVDLIQPVPPKDNRRTTNASRTIFFVFTISTLIFKGVSNRFSPSFHNAGSARDLVAFIDQTEMNEHVLNEIDLRLNYLSRSFY